MFHSMDCCQSIYELSFCLSEDVRKEQKAGKGYSARAGHVLTSPLRDHEVPTAVFAQESAARPTRCFTERQRQGSEGSPNQTAPVKQEPDTSQFFFLKL